MKLDDFLKIEKVRCVKAYRDCLTVGKEYSVLNTRMEVEVRDDEGGKYYWESDHFEPVIDPTENPPQASELTPEFEAVEPKFQVGDKVYFGANPKIQTIESIHTHDIKFIGVGGWAYTKKCCHATQENYERLQATFTDIDFEQPPKPLMGIELAKAMLDKGWHGVYGIGGSPNVSSLPVGDCVVVTSYSAYGVCLDHGIGLYKEFTPLDIRTGELLTEAVLDEN